MIRVEYNNPNLTLRDRPTNWGSGVLLYNGINFTGIVFEYYPNTTQLSSESEYKDGIIHGYQVEYWSNGNKRIEYYEKFDKLIGSIKEWNEQGILISHQEFDEFGNWVKTIL